MSSDRRALRRSLSTNFDPGPRHRLNRLLLRARQAAHLPLLLAGKELDRPVFVVGAPRSGTSMLFSIIRASPAFAGWPGEAHEVWEADYHPALRGWSSNALDAADVTPEAAARIKRAFLLVAGTRKRLVDKTPRNSLRIPFIDALFPDARFVFLRRDGRDNVNSLINAWRTPRYRTYELPEPHSIPGVDPRWWKFVLYPGWRGDAHGPLEVVCARQWASCNEAALRARERIAGLRWVDVRYEDLVRDPVSEVERTMRSLGLPVDERVRAAAAASPGAPVNVVTPPESGKWRRENPDEIRSVRGVIEPVMTALGYSFDAD